MIKNLKKKFTIVAMCSLFVVLAAIMAVFNFLNYFRFVDDADRALHMIADNGGKFPSPPSKKKETKPDKEPGSQGNGTQGEMQKISPEAPYRTRYFSVQIDETGDMAFDLQHIAAVTEEEAGQYAREVYNSYKTKGFQGIYRYRCVRKDNTAMIIFLDCREESNSFHMSLLTSLLVSGGGLLAVFVLVLFFSGLVFRPVAEGYDRQKQFITDASHELKTPLTIIDANMEVIEMEHGADEWTQSIRKQVRRLADFTRQLVTLTKLDEGEIWKQKSKFSLTNAVNESVRSFEVVAKTSGNTVETDVDEHVTIFGNEKSIRQLISILMDNAVKYSLAESIIYVSLTKKGKKIHFSVYNKTEIVPKGNLDMLFERFYRLDVSRNSETGGSGIGLSVARAIVESHHGKIRAQSDDGKSIRVSVELADDNK